MENVMIPGTSIIFMVIATVAGLLLAVGALVFVRKRFKARYAPFFIGCAVFIIFALVLESMMHNIVLASSMGEKIMNNKWLYALYGGLAAGVFEETGRFAAFKTVMRKICDKRESLMYGAGHGGIEVIMVLVAGMISNIVVALLVNSGNLDMLLTSMPDDATRESLVATVNQLAEIAPVTFLVGVIERVSAMLTHISLSVFVYIAAKKSEKWWLYPVAILIHAFVDAVTVVLSQCGVNVYAIEGVLAVLVIILTIVAARLYKKNELAAPAPAAEQVD